MRQIILILISVAIAFPAAAGRKPQFEKAFEYSWSRNAEMVLYGTISSVEAIDDPTQPRMFKRVTLRIDSNQRGEEMAGNIDVRIDDVEFYEEDELQVGRHGSWFLHRITRPAGKNPQAHLIRYMNSSEISRDLSYTDELMQFVLQDTIDQAINTNVLGDIEPENRLKERHIELDLEYDGKGGLKELSVAVPSGNILFDEHVAETIVYMHRNMVYPEIMLKATVQITRQPRGKSTLRR